MDSCLKVRSIIPAKQHCSDQNQIFNVPLQAYEQNDTTRFKKVQNIFL